MRTKITNVLLLPGATGDKHLSFISDAEVLVDGNRIVFADKHELAPAFEADEVIDGKGRLAMPGLCNMHTHTPMTLFRGVGGNLPLERWLHEAIFPLEKHLTDEAVRAGMDLGIMEMLRTGTTSFNEMYMHMDAMANSVRDSGIRATLSYCVVDFDESCRDFEPAVDFVNHWRGAAEGRINVAISAHSEVTTTPKVLIKIRDYARQERLMVHVHVCETRLDREGGLERRGMTPPQYLESLGLLELPVVAAHCVWLDDEDIALFARRGVTIAHNPISNLKLASGIAPIAKMLDRGCKIALGTDSVASNNNLNLWEELRMASLLQKGVTLDATAISPAQALAMATVNGAEAMNYSNLGLLKFGYLADLILVDINNEHVCPNNDTESDLIYSVAGSDVSLTMVDGKVLYREGEYTTLDPKLVMSRAKKEAEALFNRAGVIRQEL